MLNVLTIFLFGTQTRDPTISVFIQFKLCTPEWVTCLCLCSSSRTMLSKLRSLPDNTDEDVYGPMLEAMCRWGKAADVITLISEWLEVALSADKADTSLNKVCGPSLFTLQWR